MTPLQFTQLVLVKVKIQLGIMNIPFDRVQNQMNHYPMIKKQNRIKKIKRHSTVICWRKQKQK